MASPSITPLRLLLWAAFALSLLSAPAFGQTVPYPSTMDPNSPLNAAPQGPTATLQGIQPNFDPYCDSCDAPPALPPGPLVGAPDVAYAQTTRFWQYTSFEYTFLAPTGGSKKLGLDRLETSATFAMPLAYQWAPLLITPGFAVNYWNGPEGDATLATPDLPPRTYDAYLDFAWRPQVTELVSADLSVRPGVYSDFKYFNKQSFRVKGRALLLFGYSSTTQVAAGIVYINRFKNKILPAGGVIWTPNPDTRFEFIFPQPKLAQRLTTVGNTDWWWYVGGEYGGGAWTIRRANGAKDGFDYNDIRAYLGFEWRPCSGLQGPIGYVELGFVFDRQVFYASRATAQFTPDPTFMLCAGFRY